MTKSIQLEQQILTAFDAALEQPSDAREVWVRETVTDPEILLGVLTLINADSTSGASLHTGQQIIQGDQGPPPERIGAYAITEQIGQGGMGAVYVGIRAAGDFEHKVAIKIVKPGILSARLVERFQRERQILASLEHPNIARLLDGGTMDDGSPYIIMEFVDGERIIDFAYQKGLDLHGRLNLFLAACDAVRFAHQSLIVHRDITPSNVLVTRDGHVKLIDFGIAKPHVSAPLDLSETGSLASLSFTPGFAAPERSLGEPATTQSDIYSLGKLLAALLQACPFPPDMGAIIKRATAHQQKDRYASVDALMNDVNRFMNGNAVEAFGPSPAYRFRKFLYRRKWSMGLSALAMTCLMGAFIATLSLYHDARIERRDAERRFNDVRNLARFMMFDLYDELIKAPGNTRAISMLSEQSFAYLDSLSADKRASLDLAVETQAGYVRLADILGNPKNQNLGQRERAGPMLDEATLSLNALFEQYPNDTAVIRALGQATFSNAVFKYVSDDDVATTLSLAHRSTDLYQTLVNNGNPSFEDQRMLIRARLMTAVPLPWVNRDEEGIYILRKTLADAENLVLGYPGEAAARSLAGSLNIELARAMIRYHDNGGPEQDVLPYWNEALRIREAALADSPNDVQSWRSLATLFVERGATLRTLGRFEDAISDLDRAEAIVHKLLAIDASDAGLVRSLGGIQDERAKSLSYSGRAAEALALSKIALANARAEFDSNPGNAGYAREWAYSLVLHAQTFLNADQRTEGCRLVETAAAAWSEIELKAGISALDQNVSIANLNVLQARCAAAQD